MSDWLSFWSKNPKLFGIVMQKNAVYFADKLLKRKVIQSTHRLLDIGCGPGFLAEQLQDKVSGYYGVDISENCIQTCRKKFEGKTNIQFMQIDSADNENSLAYFEKNTIQFDVIVILSVVQYFSDIAKVEVLLSNCKKILAPNGKIILADVIQTEKGLLKDAFSVLVDSIQKNYFMSFLRFLYEARFSKYNELRIKNNLLNIPEEAIEKICNHLNLQFTLMPTCTLQHSRVSYCITAR
ncbi:MAG: class I SAM-dependent methyltransferase [Chitinophagia bacterium]|jgi:2-polyprenyl-3-methyl-5-hydroxy-6-metoxy-1,4-benzoquinol methylase